MKLRYKETGSLTSGNRFNTSALAEVITEDGSAFISDLDVFIEQKNDWKDMLMAFEDHDIINDNYNTCFFEPKTEEDRKRGFTL